MVFWTVVMLVVAAVCLMGWRMDRKRRVRAIDLDAPGHQQDASLGNLYATRHNGPFGAEGGFGGGGGDSN